MIVNPKPFTAYGIKNGELALFKKGNIDISYWESYWEGRLDALFSQNQLNLYNPVLKYINKRELVLEAGCGPGHIVKNLLDKGYKTEGIDYEEHAINAARHKYPDLPIRKGNILDIKTEDHYYGTYYSIGVLEHFTNGLDEALIEAKRVVKKDGLYLISMPYLNRERKKLKNKLLASKEARLEDGYKFYQYYYDASFIERKFNEHGIVVIKKFPYATSAFLSREKQLYKRYPFIPYRLKNFLIKSVDFLPACIKKDLSHMMMYVAKNKF